MNALSSNSRPTLPASGTSLHLDARVGCFVKKDCHGLNAADVSLQLRHLSFQLFFWRYHQSLNAPISRDLLQRSARTSSGYCRRKVCVSLAYENKAAEVHSLPKRRNSQSPKLPGAWELAARLSVAFFRRILK